jgi:hypothetical protein
VYCGVVSSVLAWQTPSASAAYTNVFDALRAELLSRSLTLSNSTDKVDQKNKKVIDKAIKAIDKPAKTLANDINTAAKIAKSLAKAFPADFPTNDTVSVMAPAPTIAGPTLLSLFEDVFSDIATIITDTLTQLSTTVAGLADSKNKTKAQEAITGAQNALAVANVADNFKDVVKALSRAFKFVVAGQKAAAKPTGGGGGGNCGTITTSTVTMTVNSVAWSATMNPPSSFAGGEYIVSTGFFNVGGTAADGSALGLSVDSGVTGPGTYPIATNSIYTVGSPPTQIFTVTSGTITITGLNTTSWTTCGTATFSATDGVTPITVTDFEFVIKDLGH